MVSHWLVSGTRTSLQIITSKFLQHLLLTWLNVCSRESSLQNFRPLIFWVSVQKSTTKGWLRNLDNYVTLQPQLILLLLSRCRYRIPRQVIAWQNLGKVNLAAHSVNYILDGSLIILVQVTMKLSPSYPDVPRFTVKCSITEDLHSASAPQVRSCNYSRNTKIKSTFWQKRNFWKSSSIDERLCSPVGKERATRTIINVTTMTAT